MLSTALSQALLNPAHVCIDLSHAAAVRSTKTRNLPIFVQRLQHLVLPSGMKTMEELDTRMESGIVTPLSEHSGNDHLDCMTSGQRLTRVRQLDRYYTFDHRRVWCMFKAGCGQIRVRTELDFGRSFVVTSLCPL